MELRPDGRILSGQADSVGHVRPEVDLPLVHGIGYQGRSVEAFVQCLTDAEVEVVVDVRAAAWSQRPAFRKTALSNALGAAGIGYEHLKAAGNPFRPRRGETLEWRECAKLYRAHLREHPEVIEALASAVAGRRVALLCFEAKRSECHRGILLSALRRRVKLDVADL